MSSAWLHGRIKGWGREMSRQDEKCQLRMEKVFESQTFVARTRPKQTFSTPVNTSCHVSSSSIDQHPRTSESQLT